jgi:competence protein ComEC
LTAFYFGRFSPVAIAANVVVIPLTFLSVLCGCLSVLLGSCAAFLADIFNHANAALVWALIGVVRVVSRVPGGTFEVAQLPAAWVPALYAALAAAGVLLFARSAGGRRRPAAGVE